MCAAAAGVPGATLPMMFVWRVTETRKSAVNSRIANTRFTTGPAKIAVRRRQVTARQ